MDEKTKLLSEHIRNRISHTQPHNVLCVVAFADMTKAITRLPHQSPSISIPVAWFVQSRKCTEYMMRNWLQEAWEPLPGGLADSPQFLDFSQRAASLESSWFRLGIFGALGLNNRARADARTERKVLRPLPALARPRLRLVPRCSRDRISPLFAETGNRDAPRGPGTEESCEAGASGGGRRKRKPAASTGARRRAPSAGAILRPGTYRDVHATGPSPEGAAADETASGAADSADPGLRGAQRGPAPEESRGARLRRRATGGGSGACSSRRQHSNIAPRCRSWGGGGRRRPCRHRCGGRRKRRSTASTGVRVGTFPDFRVAPETPAAVC